MYGTGDVFMGGQIPGRTRGRPDHWVMAGIFGMDVCTGSANCIIVAN